MDLPFELHVALRYLFAKRKQAFISVISFISTLGVTVGVMALVVALALMTGLQQELRDRIVARTRTFTSGTRGGIDGLPRRGAMRKVPHVSARAAIMGRGCRRARRSRAGSRDRSRLETRCNLKGGHAAEPRSPHPPEGECRHPPRQGPRGQARRRHGDSVSLTLGVTLTRRDCCANAPAARRGCFSSALRVRLRFGFVARRRERGCSARTRSI
jgi:hypothetical protein